MEQRDAYSDHPAFYAAYPGDGLAPHPELPIRPIPHGGDPSTAAVIAAFEADIARSLRAHPRRSSGWGATDKECPQ